MTRVKAAPEGSRGALEAPLLALAVAVLSISTAAPLARLAAVDGVTAAWWRLLVGSLLTLAAAAARRELPRSRGLLPHSLAAGLLLAAHFALWFQSLHYATVASSTGIVVAYPVIAAVAEAAVEKRGATRRLLGAVLGFAGVAVLSTPWAGATPLGAGLSLAAAAAAAGYFLIGRRLRVKGATTLEYTSAVYTAAFLASSLYAATLKTAPWRVPSHSIPYLVALGVIPMLGGHTMMNYALAYYPASTVTTAALLEPFGASLLAWLLLGEQPPPAALPGAALTATGAWLALQEASLRGSTKK